MPKEPGIYPLQQVVFHNPPIAEVPDALLPRISDEAVIGVGSMVIGDVQVEKDVFIGFHNIIRADSSSGFYIGERTNIQDFVLMHVHPRQSVTVKGTPYGVYIEGDVSILHHAAAHGPLYVGRNTFIGQHVSVYGAMIGRDCVLMHGAVVCNNVRIANNRLVAPGQSIYTQAQADALPEVPDSLKQLNPEIVDHYYRLGKSYRQHTPLVF